MSERRKAELALIARPAKSLLVQASQGGGEDEVLSPDEELFVSAFVDYWLRRGATIFGGDE